jgi:hypothetical protein
VNEFAFGTRFVNLNSQPVLTSVGVNHSHIAPGLSARETRSALSSASGWLFPDAFLPRIMRLRRPSVKSAESEVCQCHAEQESGEDRKPHDHKTIAGVGGRYDSVQEY